MIKMADGAAVAAAGSDIVPNQTIYLNNLNEKIKKSQLKKSLYTVFSPFGNVVDIVACKTKHLRGQAWVAFSDVAASTNALRALQGFPFYDKPMKIQFAKEKSISIEKLEGSYKPRPKRRREDDEEVGKGSKKAAAAPAAAVAAVAPAASLPVVALPSKMLLVQGLPSDQSDETLKSLLQSLFGQFPNLVDIRPIAIRGIAFVEYANESSAMPACVTLHNFKLSPTQSLTVTYAK